MAQLRRLNLDSSWLLTLPTSPEYATRTVNVLIDPWLDDAEQVDYARSFSVQRRQTPALATSVAALESLLESEFVSESPSDGRRRSTRIDVILISHPFTDHMHPQTLADEATCPSRIPLLATADAYAPLCALLGKARTIVKMETADMRQRPTTLSGAGRAASSPSWLPSNVVVLQAVPRERLLMLQGPAGMAWQKLHGGVLLLWRDDAQVSSILYSPHGIAETSIPVWLSAASAEDDERIEHWAILTSFDRIVLPRWLSGTVNLGLAGALSLLSPRSRPASAPPYAARYLVDTHGEHKQKAGLVAQLLRRFWLASTEEVRQLDPEKERLRQEEAQKQLDNILSPDTPPAASRTSTQAIVLTVGQTLPLH